MQDTFYLSEEMLLWTHTSPAQIRTMKAQRLKGALEFFAREMFGPRSQIGFRPSFSPFTEPSAEVDVWCFLSGEGCRVCWLRPRGGHGLGFLDGLKRIAVLKYGINDIRLFF